MKRLLIFVFIIFLTLCGCGKEDTTIFSVDKNSVYRSAPIKINLPSEYSDFTFDNYYIANDNVFFVIRSEKITEEEIITNYLWGYADLNGENAVILNPVYEESEADATFDNPRIVGSNENAVVITYYSFAKTVDDYGDSRSDYLGQFISVYDFQGYEIAKKKLASLNISETDNIFLLDEDCIYTTDYNNMCVWNYISDKCESKAAGKYESLIQMGDKSVLGVYTENEESKYVRINSLLEEEYVTDVIYDVFDNGNAFFPGNVDQPVLIVSADGKRIYGFDIEGQQEIELCNAEYSGLNIKTWNLEGVYWAENDNIFLSEKEETRDGQEHFLRKLVKVKPEDVKERIELRVGVIGIIDDYLENYVATFNSENPEYYVTLLKYDDEDSEKISQFEKDIISGKTLDIIINARYVNDPSFSINNLISKGVFISLDSLIKEDEEISVNDYFPSALNMGTYDGKLYTFTPSFSVQTMICKSKTMENVGDLCFFDIKKMSDDSPVFFDESGETLLDKFLRPSASIFINVEDGKCNFDTEEFGCLMNLIKDYDTKWGDISDENMYEYDDIRKEAYSSNQALFCLLQLTDIEDLRLYEDLVFGDKVSPMNFPSMDSSTGYLIPEDYIVGISAKTKDADGAWKFIRYFFSDEYQNSRWHFPASIKAFENKANELIKEEKLEGWYMYDVIDLPPITSEDVEKVENIILSSDGTGCVDSTIIDIIGEEMAPFLAGEKTEKEIRKIIQSRIKLYLKENR